MQKTITDLKMNPDGTIPYEMIPLPKKNVQTQIRKMLVRIDKLEKLAGVNGVSKIEPKAEIKTEIKTEPKAKKKTKR